MNPSSEVEEASGEEKGIEETMEAVVTAMDAMTSVVETTEAMMMAVEMREWLEVGRPETERTTAVHFFSRALAVQREDGYPPCTLPLCWPGLLPDLVQLLADCLLPHNSKSIQSHAVLSIKYLISNHVHRVQLLRAVAISAYEHLLPLVRETDWTEIRDQAIRLLGQMTAESFRDDIDTAWILVLLPLLGDLVGKYAAIQEPMETEISSLDTAITALHPMLGHLLADPTHPQEWGSAHFKEIHTLLIGIFREPGKRKKAQIGTGELLSDLMSHLDGVFLLESGVIEMLLETLRVGKEPTPILVLALQALNTFLEKEGVEAELVKKVLEMGTLDVFHLVLKRSNDRFKDHTLWDSVMDCLESLLMEHPGEHLEAILNQSGLVDLVLDLALGMDTSEEQRDYLLTTQNLLRVFTEHCSQSQMQQLMFKSSFFPLLSRYLNLNWEYRLAWTERLLIMLRVCLALSSEEKMRILRRLLDDTGITDAVRRIKLTGSLEAKDIATGILDTYLNNPLPPPSSHNLPSLIYTRNAAP